MRVAQSQLVNNGGAVITADELLSGSVPRRPPLSLTLDYKPHDISDDIERGTLLLDQLVSLPKEPQRAESKSEHWGYYEQLNN